MRIASSVRWTRFVVASLVLLAAGLASRSPRESRPTCGNRRLSVLVTTPVEIPIEVQAATPPPPGGPYRALEFSSMRVESLEPPMWFGERSKPLVRIAGKVLGAERATTVRLGLDVPEPGIWPGRVTSVEADGTFDFGLVRPGPYLLVAFGGDRVSRMTPVDTTKEPGDQITLFAAPCRPLHGTFWTTEERFSYDATPAAGVAVELSGWVLGVTDAFGAYDVCVPDNVDHSKLRVPGFSDPPAGYHADRYNHRLLWPKYLEEGFVVDAKGAPVADVGVQPIWRTGDGHCRAGGEVRTTSGQARSKGSFSYNGANRLCGFRILRGALVHDQRYDGLRFDDPQILVIPAKGQERRLFD